MSDARHHSEVSGFNWIFFVMSQLATFAAIYILLDSLQNQNTRICFENKNAWTCY